jgi:hypothetical protein
MSAPAFKCWKTDVQRTVGSCRVVKIKTCLVPNRPPHFTGTSRWPLLTTSSLNTLKWSLESCALNTRLHMRFQHDGAFSVICVHVTIREPLTGFWWVFILESFMKLCWNMLILVNIKQNSKHFTWKHTSYNRPTQPRLARRMMMVLSPRDTGCFGDQAVRNPREWGLSEHPQNHFLDMFYWRNQPATANAHFVHCPHPRSLHTQLPQLTFYPIRLSTPRARSAGGPLAGKGACTRSDLPASRKDCTTTKCTLLCALLESN